MLSIIIPCHNEARHLNLLLMSLTHSAVNIDSIEVLIVDDASIDETAMIMARWETEWNAVRPVFLKENLGPAGARNRGVSFSKGACLAFIDADAIVEEEWIPCALECAAQAPAQSITGGSVFSLFNAKDPFQKAAANVIRHKPRYGRDRELLDLPGGNLVLSSELFHDLGGFDERLRTGEDTDFVYRARMAGAKLAFDERLIIYHQVPSSPSEMFRSHFGYGRAFVRHVNRTGDGSLRLGLCGKSLVASVWWQLWLALAALAWVLNREVFACVCGIYLLGPVKLLLMSSRLTKYRSASKMLMLLALITRNWGYQLGFFCGWMAGRNE